MYRTAYNTTDSVVVVDPAGRTLGGREHGPVDDLFDEVDRAIERGDLVIVADTDTLAQVPEVVDLTVELNDRRKAFLDDATPSDLRALAELRGLPCAEQTPTALAAMLAPTGATLDELAEDHDEQEA